MRHISLPMHSEQDSTCLWKAAETAACSYTLGLSQSCLLVPGNHPGSDEWAGTLQVILSKLLPTSHPSGWYVCFDVVIDPIHSLGNMTLLGLLSKILTCAAKCMTVSISSVFSTKLRRSIDWMSPLTNCGEKADESKNMSSTRVRCV